MSFSGTFFALSTRSSYGLLASSEAVSGTSASMEGAGDDVHLLLARQPHEVHGIAGDADGQARVFLRVVHGVHQRLAVQDVDVHVVAGGAEERVEHGGQVGNALLLKPAETDRHDGRGQRDAV